MDQAMTQVVIATHFELILEELDIEETVHTKDTPKRYAQALIELMTPIDFTFTTFDSTDINQMIAVTDVPFYSLCAHHVLPFYGKAHIAYIPGKKIAGLSKLSRTVDYFSRGLNVQEELTKDIMDFLVEHLEPMGAMVVLEGHHLCMAMRGAETQQHRTTTSALHGVFLDPTKQARQEFLELVK